MKNVLKKIFHIDHLMVSALTLLVIGFLVVATINLEFLNPLVHAVESFSMSDIYYRIQNTGERQVNKQITLVEMTELTSRDRGRIAEVVDKISSMHPTALGIDIIFEGYKDDADADAQLTEAFFGTPENTVLAYKLTEPDEKTFTFNNSVHSFFVNDTHQVEGTVNVTNNPHKSLTTYPVYFIERGDTVYSLPTLLAQMLGVKIDSGKREYRINYKGTAFPVVDWKDLDKHRDLIENRIVLLGSTREEADKHYTPLGQLPGMEILAYTLQSMLEGSDVSTAPLWQVVLLALLAGYLTNVIDFFVSNAIYHRKSAIMVFITQSEFYDKLISFIVMVVLTFFTFMLFAKMNYFIDSVLGLSTIVLIEEGRLLYVGILAVLKKAFGKKIVEKSIYAEELEGV